jgi:branched-chain amino acid transport system ATP-binding protein
MLWVENLDVFYGDLQALDQVSFTLEPGEIVSVIGSNGAGKSTTLKTVSGLLRPKTGRIVFLDEEIQRAPSFRIVELGLSHVPEGRQIFPSLTVAENLEMGAQFPEMKKVRGRSMDQVYDYFPRLAERRDQKAGTLSGGEQQMLAIGRGLMSLPKLMMLDEPSLGLSPLLVSTIFEIIKRINKEGTSILLIEQNVYHALTISNRGYILENGRVALSGSGEELLTNPHIRKTYLGL